LERPIKVILDYDGTLTAEEEMVEELAQRSLDTLSQEILKAPRARLEEEYEITKRSLLSRPHEFGWRVKGLLASYCDEGAFILNTATIQVLLEDNPRYLKALEVFFPEPEYDPMVDCTNYLFHRHTAQLTPRFRPGAKALLDSFLRHREFVPLILTNSRGEKVKENLALLNLGDIGILGDTRQYEMEPSWNMPEGEDSLKVDQLHTIDLRRPAYYKALMGEAKGAKEIVVVADTLSLPGALPLALGMRFFLLMTPYTPPWCREFVRNHPRGQILERLSLLVERLIDRGEEIC
jgi:phosphoglycolate phosphatase-like HAD superfamily hydrolase